MTTTNRPTPPPLIAVPHDLALDDARHCVIAGGQEECDAVIHFWVDNTACSAELQAAA